MTVAIKNVFNAVQSCTGCQIEVWLVNSGIIINTMVCTWEPRRFITSLVLVAGSTVLTLGLVPASASSANISHSYQSVKSIPAGSLVSLDSAKPDFVQSASTANASRVLGIAVVSKDSLLAIDASKDTVQVATSGIATAIVSDYNGSLSVGDQVAVSPFDGVGMKAEVGSRVIGLAQTAFSAASPGAKEQTITDTKGKSKQVAVGTVRLNIAPGSANGTGLDKKINGLQSVVRAITGKVIPTGRITIALIITVLTFVALVSLIYGSVYSTIVSVGRNPLAKYAIYRSLRSVLLMAFIIGMVAIVVVSLLLR